jgi:hypothetical protein
MSKAQQNKRELELNRIHQLLVNAAAGNLFGENSKADCTKVVVQG